MEAKGLKEHIRDVPDFPREGIVFKDITPVLLCSHALHEATSLFVERHKDKKIDKIAAIESRGFIFGSTVAHQLDLGFIPIRKEGKLPYHTIKESYELEYGQATLELHTDALVKGETVLLIDDLLATGGTATAAANLVEKLGGIIGEIDFLVELSFLGGRARLSEYNVFAPIVY